MRKRTKKKKKRKKRKEEAAKREREKKRKRIPKWKANPQLKGRVGFRPVFFFFPALTSFLSSLAHTLSHSSFPHCQLGGHERGPSVVVLSPFHST